MGTLEVVIFALWIAPVIGVSLAFRIQSKAARRELREFTTDRAVEYSAARRLVHEVEPVASFAGYSSDLAPADVATSYRLCLN